MSKNSADTDALTDLIAEETGTDPEEVEAGSEEFEIESPEEAEWAYVD